MSEPGIGHGQAVGAVRAEIACLKKHPLGQSHIPTGTARDFFRSVSSEPG